MAITAPATHAQDAALSDADTAAMVQMADTLLQRRADAVTTAPQSGLATEPVEMTKAAGDDFAADLAVLQRNAEGLEKINGGYSRAEVDVTPDGASISGDTATLKVTEETRLYFPHPGPGGPAYEGYSIPHTLTFTRAGQGGWEVADDQAQVNRSAVLPSTQITEVVDPGPINEPGPTDDGGPINEPGPDADPAPEPEPLDLGPIPDEPASTSPLPPEVTAQEQKSVGAASYAKMVDYAQHFVYSYNPAYRKYDKDCTNFISQALRAGGWSMTGSGYLDRKNASKWYYGGYTWTTSYTWAGAQNWYWFTRHSGRTRPLDNVWKMLPSDVLQIDFVVTRTGRPDGVINHTMMVTKKEASGELFLTAHTNNVLNKPLTTILFENRGAWFYAHRT